MHRQVVGAVGCEPHGQMVGGVGDSPRTPEGDKLEKDDGRCGESGGVRTARADSGRDGSGGSDGNGGRGGRGEKGKTLSEFWDFDKVYWIFIARVEGFEPPSTVLETAILPLNYTRILKKF